MADRTPDNPDLAVDELKRKARRRLVGAVVLALAAAIVLPMLLEKEPKPLGEDVSVRIPPMDDSRLVRSLGDKGTGRAAGAANPAPEGAPAKTEPAAPQAIAAPKEEASARSDVPTEAKVEPKPSVPPVAGAAPVSAPKKSIADVEQQMLSATRKPTPAPAAAEPGNADATGLPPPSAAARKAESAPGSPSADARTVTPTADARAVTPPAATAPASSSTAASAPSGVPAAAPAVAATEGYVVQLAAFADDKGANALAGRLKKSGYGAYVEPVQTSRGTLWRVRIGGYPSRDAADAARDKLKTEGQNGIVVPPR